MTSCTPCSSLDQCMHPWTVESQSFYTMFTYSLPSSMYIWSHTSWTGTSFTGTSEVSWSAPRKVTGNFFLSQQAYWLEIQKPCINWNNRGLIDPWSLIGRVHVPLDYEEPIISYHVDAKPMFPVCTFDMKWTGLELDWLVIMTFAPITTELSLYHTLQ